jgi:inhibitor of Bruton tyrosine kinase
MTQLHAYFSVRQQQNFQRLLDGSRSQPSSSSLSNSGGKSWSRPSALTSAMICDVNVNARDWLGRTVLHLACASVEPSSLEYVRLLLAHPAININLQDTESHWTALHRALFHGNIAAA